MAKEKNIQLVSPSSQEALEELIRDPYLERLEDLLAEFNLFDVLGIARREPLHSAFLAWLLNPRGSHGLRDYFLRRFLSEAVAEGQIADVTPLDVDGWKLTDIEVVTERHKIDILLIDEADGFVCLIENKIGAGEHSDQLGRYLRTVESQYEGLTPLPIFLTPDATEPDEEEDAERWAPFDYGKVAALIDRTLDTRGSTISASVHSFLDQYKGALGRHVLDTADNIGELALQIYNNHRDAIDLIINAKPALEAAGWDVIDLQVEQYASLFQADYHSKWYHRFYSPWLDEIPELKEGRGWTESGRILLFEVKYRERRLVLNVGPGPDVTRKRLYDLVQRDGVPGVAMRRARKLSKTYHIVYSKPLLGKGGSPQPDYEKAQPQIEQVIANFIENDYWPLVNAIRVEFGLPAASPP